MKVKEFDPQSLDYQCVDSLDEAEALVTSYPNSSKAWMLYIVFCLKQAEVNKARSVAQRALKKINFREEKEKLDVWKAYLNLENKYGSKESLETVLKEALQYQDKYKIYRHLVQLYIKSGKTEELDALSKIVLKKFKTEKDIWLDYLTYYMKCPDKQREARFLFDRSRICLPPGDCVDVKGKFAYLEYRYGNIDKSFRMFEEILAKYPKRKDLKATYIQILKAHGQDERANSLL